MSSTNGQPPPSIIRPGKAPEGPPGWEKRRIEKQVQQEQEQEKRNHRRENSSGMQGIKDKVHKIGEKMHLVEPRDPAQRTAAQLQVGTMVTRNASVLPMLQLTLPAYCMRNRSRTRTPPRCPSKPQCTHEGVDQAFF
ncbi:hypothetical protein BCV70DRAFT_198419 [Testicularia cyperi]|uniref:Uncharacterized protein n=1 Tax=Testicularia cyperi TaxID=1882483 RepID=A0A317XW53_9BASI|nr:hypothetical protein BCV70DRAFT_198419 [Testicularia cyperi]